MSEVVTPEKKEIGPASFGIGKIWHEVHDLPRLSKAGMAAHLAGEAWRSLVSTPLVSAITVLTIALSLFLLSAFILLLQNVGSALSVSQSDMGLSVYLSDEASAVQSKSVHDYLQQKPQVAKFKFIDKAAALDEFSKSLGGDAELLDGFAQQNPLPASFEVELKPEFSSKDVFERMQAELSQNPAVEKVYFSSGMITQFSSLLTAFRNGGALAVLLMVLMVSSIICNTIRLALYSRREELEIMRLVGATRSFIRAPCLIEGVIQGVLGAILALLVLWLLYLGVQNALLSSDVFVLLFPELGFLSIQGMIIVVFFGLLVGILGSHFSARPFLEEQ